MMLSDDNPQEQFMNRPTVPNAAMSAKRMGGSEQFNSHSSDLDKGSSARIGKPAKTITNARRSGRGAAKASGGSNAARGASPRPRGGGGGTPTRAGGPGPQFKGLAPGRATPRATGKRLGGGPGIYGAASRASGRSAGGAGSTRSAGISRGSKR